MCDVNTARSRIAFPLLADAGRYRPCETDLLTDLEAQAYWLDVFDRHTAVLLEAAVESGYSADAARAAGVEWNAELSSLKREPSMHGRLDILLLDQRRRAVLDRHGIFDEFRSLKQRENERAMRALPRWAARLDSLTDLRERFTLLVRGMLAGNLFDMGVPEMAKRYSEQAMSFDDAIGLVPDRPWLVDHLDDAAAWIESSRPAKAVVFVDNAGGDFVLGVIPLVRFLLDRTETVILAANESPSHNDVTVDDVRPLLVQAASLDGRLIAERVRVVSNGHGAPLIDLRCITPELASAAADAELVVLVGMGRSVESNLSARLTCPAWKIAMIKDDFVARTVGGKKFDAVFRFERPREES